jgi:MoaA/NifB/PqqE/SkfB family radical SAM enzyme
MSTTSATPDTAVLRPPFHEPARFALGIGLTNECNLSCAFCYRDPTRVDRLSLGQVRSVVERLPVRSVNLGTGENGMHPDFRAILSYLRHEPLKLTITSNGHSIAVLDDADVTAFKMSSSRSITRASPSRTASGGPETGISSTSRRPAAVGWGCPSPSSPS